MNSQDKEKQKKFSKIEKKIIQFNKDHPIGTKVKYMSDDKKTHPVMVTGSARQIENSVYLQIQGVPGVVSIERIQPIE